MLTPGNLLKLATLSLLTTLTACGGGGGDSAPPNYTVSTSAGIGGSISPASTLIKVAGATINLTVTPQNGYAINSVSGCNGTLTGNSYTTGTITASCTVTASFAPVYTVTANAGSGGVISPDSVSVAENGTTSFTLTPDSGNGINTVSGCGVGTLIGNTYTTGPITSACTVTANFATLPAKPALVLTPQSIKTFRFTWVDVATETEYRLLENPDGISGYTQVASIAANSVDYDHVVSLPGRINARYILQACNGGACTDSTEVLVSGTLANAVGYFKASNTETLDAFGGSVALAADGNTLAVGAYRESSNATGIGGSQTNNTALYSGAVYVFTRTGSSWSQQAYIKASNTEASDSFGSSVTLTADGNTLAVGASGEDSSATGINSSTGQANNTASTSGAVYVFTRTGSSWSQQAYIKASNTETGDNFGISVALAADGNALAVGAQYEASSATGINSPTGQVDNSASYSGAVYVFTRTGSSWSQQAYIKASNTEASDSFGSSVTLTADGNTLAVGASGEDSSATGIDGSQTDNNYSSSGAVYVFTRTGSSWSQQAYIKASNTQANDGFGISVALAADGNTLAVGAFAEDSNATGINGNQTDNNYPSSGAVYVFTRTGSSWSQQAYIKASNTGAVDYFGLSVALAADGNALAVGARDEDSSATGINSTTGQADNAALSSGAVYVFARTGSSWSQQTYIKASNTEAYDNFGDSVALAADGNTLAVGASRDASSATGIGGSQTDNTSSISGAVYLY